ncbi:uracil-DNA glycosylase [Paracoccus sp. p4-l81]|uniref:uracil-DNA glycosylase n=1 Tax=unclassified Paracoccus (in: a-proteobacteria) TaxID=2688777 RepID=UPI0035BA07FC
MDWPAPPPGWADHAAFRLIWPRLAEALAGQPVLPAPDRIFAALSLPPDRVRVVVLGQDPYPTPGDAVGRAFAVAPNTSLPRSLSNIFKELADDGFAPPPRDLAGWTAQGVLLLNTALTVPPGQAGGHARLWQGFARALLADLPPRPRAWLLWGAHAQKAAQGLPAPGDLVIATAHPSPLSARRGFFGSRPFSRINDWFVAAGQPPIDWSA